MTGKIQPNAEHKETIGIYLEGAANEVSFTFPVIYRSVGLCCAA